jgi:hypothetical protein
MADPIKVNQLKDLTIADIDKLDHEALKAALKSVLRAPNPGELVMTHKDHRSHSSTDARIFEKNQIEKGQGR